MNQQWEKNQGQGWGANSYGSRWGSKEWRSDCNDRKPASSGGWGGNQNTEPARKHLQPPLPPVFQRDDANKRSWARERFYNGGWDNSKGWKSTGSWSRWTEEQKGKKMEDAVDLQKLASTKETETLALKDLKDEKSDIERKRAETMERFQSEMENWRSSREKEETSCRSEMKLIKKNVKKRKQEGEDEEKLNKEKKVSQGHQRLFYFLY